MQSTFAPPDVSASNRCSTGSPMGRARRRTARQADQVRGARWQVLSSAEPPLLRRRSVARASARRAGHSRASARADRARARSTKRASAASRATTSTPAPAASPSACTRRSSRFAIPASDCFARCSSWRWTKRAPTPQPPRPFAMVAGVCGHTAQARAEAEIAAELGYDAGLAQPRRLADRVGGRAARPLPRDRRGHSAVRLLSAAGGRRARALVSVLARVRRDPERVGDQDRAVQSLSDDRRRARRRRSRARRHRALHRQRRQHRRRSAHAVSRCSVGGTTVVRWIDGGLLGQWAVWTRAAVAMLAAIKMRARDRRVRADAALTRRRAHRRERRGVRRRATASPAAFRGFTRCCVVRDCSTASGASIPTRRCRPGRPRRSRASSEAIRK